MIIAQRASTHDVSGQFNHVQLTSVYTWAAPFYDRSLEDHGGGDGAHLNGGVELAPY